MYSENDVDISDKKITEHLKKVFSDFKADVLLDSSSTTIIKWANKDGSKDNNMEFIISGSKLYTSGDLGSNIFAWDVDLSKREKLSLSWLGSQDVDSIFNNRVAGDVNEQLWDAELCESEARDLLAIELLDSPPLAAHEIWTDFNDKIEFSGCFEGPEEWKDWLHSDGKQFFGDDLDADIYSIGENTHTYRRLALVEALSLIAPQVEEKRALEKALEVSESPDEEMAIPSSPKP